MTEINPTPAGRVKVTDTARMSALANEAKLQPGFLHGQETAIHKQTNRKYIEHEQIWHRHAAQYLAMNVPMKDVAKLCEVSKEELQNLLRSPWFLERIANLIDSGHTDTMALLKSAAAGAVVTLVEICENQKAPAAARVASAKEILDRNLGKSLVTIESKTEISTNPVADVAKLEAEVSRLRQGGNFSSSQS